MVDGPALRSRRSHEGGFTLIELLTVVAIMGTMVAVGVVSWQRGRSSSQLAGAARDILAVIRQARSIALVTQTPAIITYANDKNDDEESVARITVEAKKLFEGEENSETVRTISGEVVGGKDAKSETISVSSTTEPAETDGESLDEVLTPKISLEVVKGLRIKVLKEDEQLGIRPGAHVYKSSISIYSTSGAVRQGLGVKTESVNKGSTVEPGIDQATDEPVEIVWGANGRADAHTVWIYPEGSDPEKGLSIKVDKFGGCKVSQWEEEK